MSTVGAHLNMQLSIEIQRAAVNIMAHLSDDRPTFACNGLLIDAGCALHDASIGRNLLTWQNTNSIAVAQLAKRNHPLVVLLHLASV